jgi:hypothetical protein
MVQFIHRQLHVFIQYQLRSLTTQCTELGAKCSGRLVREVVT